MWTKTTWSKGNGAGNPFSAGTGWGGPARGASRSHKSAPYAPGNRAAAGRAAPDRERLAAEQARVEAMLDGLYELALNARDQNTQIAACDAYLNRVEGRPRTMIEVAADETRAEPEQSIRVRVNRR